MSTYVEVAWGWVKTSEWNGAKDPWHFMSVRLSFPSQKCSFGRGNSSQVPNPLKVLQELPATPHLSAFLFLLPLYPIATSWFLASHFPNVLLCGAHGTKIEFGYFLPIMGHAWAAKAGPRTGCTEPAGAALPQDYWGRILGRGAQSSVFSISPKAIDIGDEQVSLWLGPISLHRLTLH